jgi:hypothetical protein
MVSQLVCSACRLAHAHNIHTHSLALRHTTPYSYPPTTHSHIVHEPRSRTDAGGEQGGGIGAGVDVVYPTPLPILTPIKVFQDADGNLLSVSELNSHTAVIGRSGEGKTHLTCHLIMQWAPIKGWNHGWVIAIMPRSVRARALALLTSP